MWLFRKRKYPIKRDEKGGSARQRAFELFGAGERPSQVCKIIPISLRTACRYFEDFKKLHHRVPYGTIRQWLRENPELSEKVIAILADSLGMSREEVFARTEKPWGLLQAAKGKWPNYRLERQRTEIEERLLAALEVVKFCEVFGHKDPKFVSDTLMKFIIEEGVESPEV